MHTQRFFFSLIILTIAAGISDGGLKAQPLVDSLFRTIPSLDATHKLVAFIQLVESIQDSSRFYYAQRALALARQAGDDSLLIQTYQALGRALQQGNIDARATAANYWQQALQIAQKHEWHHKTTTLAAQLGNYYQSIAIYEIAAEYYFVALQSAEYMQNQKLAGNIHHQLGMVYGELRQHQQAIHHYRKAQDIAQAMNDSIAMADVLNNLAIEYTAIGQYQRAIRLLGIATDIYTRQQQYHLLSYPYNNLGDVYLAIGQLSTSLDYYRKALQIDEQHTDSMGIAIGYLSIAKVYHRQGDHYHALLFLGRALSHFESQQRVPELIEAYQLAIECARKLKNYQQALEYYDLYSHLKEQTLSEEKIRQSLLAQLNYETQLNEQRIRLLEQEKAIAEYRQHQQRYLNYLLASLGIIMLGISLILYYRYHHHRYMRRQLEAQKQLIEQKNQSLQQLTHTQNQLFSIISHDIRSPLNSLAGFLEAVTQQSAAFRKEEIVDLLRRLSSSVQSLRQLIDNLLTWARQQSGHIQFKAQKIELSALLQSVIGLVQPHAEQKSISINTQLPQPLPMIADEQLLHFVLRNLLTNAVKFTPAGGHIQLEVSQHTKGYYRICIRDTGIGMPAYLVDQINKQQTAESRRGTHDEQGTGLGLPLCFEFVRMHRGTIEVHSQEGKGSEFIVTLPVQTVLT